MFTVEYLKPLRKNFRKRENAIAFIHQQYEITRFIETKKGMMFNLQIPPRNIETMRVGLWNSR